MRRCKGVEVTAVGEGLVEFETSVRYRSENVYRIRGEREELVNCFRF